MDTSTGRWWDKPLGLTHGCSPVSAACKHCWSAASAHIRQHQKNEKIRAMYENLTTLHFGIPSFNGKVRIVREALEIPKRTRKPTVFAVWDDLFHEAISLEFIISAMKMMRAEERHTFIVLTKRPWRVDYDTRDIGAFIIPDNVYIGTTLESDSVYEDRMGPLLNVDGKKVLSMEPLLGPVSFHLSSLRQISSVIIGAESGRNARPTDLKWVRDIIWQCDNAGVPVFVKQLQIGGKLSTDMTEWPEDLRRRELPWERK
jgi:protein gp37